MHLNYAQVKAAPRVETRLTRETATRLIGLHLGATQFAAIFGPAGIGKTEAAKLLNDTLHRDAENKVPASFRAKYIEMPTVRKYTGNVEKQALGVIYNEVIGPLSPNEARGMSQQIMVRSIVQQLETGNIQMLFIDEAGRIDAQALEALTYLLNSASHSAHPLTIVLIGMHDLPHLIERVPQVHSRVADTITLREYDASGAYDLLSKIYPAIGALRFETPEAAALMEYLVSACHGVAREMVHLVDRASAMASMRGVPLNLTALKAARHLSLSDHEAAKQIAIPTPPIRRRVLR